MTKNILWTAAEIVQATGGATTKDFECSGVSIDTRTLKPGDLFIALKGDALDGHDYVEMAFRAGAAAALVKKEFIPKSDAPLVRVDDTMTALENLGKAARDRSHAKIIAVTGSAGKTGTKEMLAIAFGALGKTHASKKSFNNHWGVPLSLSTMPKDAAYGIFELGMNHVGELAQLTAQVRPHIALITTVEPVHIEHFKNVEEIADAKAEIFLSMDKDGIAVLNFDNPHFARLKGYAEKRGIVKIFSFGEDEDAQSRLIDCALHADSSHITAEILGERIKYKLNIPGKHIAMNSLGVFTIVKAAGGNLAAAAEALRNSMPVEGRGNRILVTIAEGQPPLTIINESYNANPASMLAAFKVFEMAVPPAGGRRIAVLGDMLELGRDGPRLHAELANPLLKAKTDLVFCCGAQMDALYHVLPPDWRGAHTKDSQELAKQVAAAVGPGDIVLVKGSAGSKMSYVVQALQSLALPQGKTKEQLHAL
ncbi:MAG: UDP-N-acetylmuramoylalanyl-D-glutamyl-2,6-diaminopimelate--D-alanyl-D-alanine ligase [Alphaproteobacteria bacterium]|nr:UDP-N-acetylmuramoylalanyl-D-glutamyl-2,6-diaminopimelate--D-alanyl-D-alanine ligase [Alphaproteobacteria bacterium]